MDGPRVLILGHSFIRRLRDFVTKNATNYQLNLNLTESVTVRWHGVGGRTITKFESSSPGLQGREGEGWIGGGLRLATTHSSL